MPTRRSVLRGAAAGLLAGTAAPLVALDAAASAAPLEPAGGQVTAPPALDIRRTSVGAGTTQAEAAFPLSHLSVSWEGPETGAAIRLQTADGWSGWTEATGCPSGKGDQPGAQRHATLLSAAGAVGYEVSLPAAATAATVTELNTTEPAAAAARRCDRGTAISPLFGRYLTRAGWGADEKLRFAPDGTEIWPPAYFPVQMLTVHHQGDDKDDAQDPLATMRAIYYNDAVNKGNGDFGYHLGIDRQGRIYEGRYSGADPLPIFGGAPGPNFRPQMANAGHVFAYNAGNVGIVLLGNMSRQPTAPPQTAMLVKVLAILSAVCGIDPLATINYVNPISGAAKTVEAIAAHRAFSNTQCPGNNFFPLMDQVRKDVARLLGRRVP